VNVKDIVKAYLKANGYDGLLSDRYECGCALDDLMECDQEGIKACEPAYKGPCTCGEGCDWDMYASKEAVADAEEELATARCGDDDE
jgi:hypothetical protein